MTQALPQDDLQGARFGQYEVRRLVGRGACASVYEARHTALGKIAALKVLHAHLAEDAQLSGRFMREGRVAAQLRHPHVLDVLDVGERNGVPYLVLEFLEGRDLRAHLADEGPLEIEAALAILLPVVSALAHAHDHGVVHRDLKPGNIFLARGHQGVLVPKIVDFGLSNLAGEKPLTETDMVMGTLAYMAPEQTLGVRFTDRESDQYSFGVLLYECLTGQRPYDRPTFYGTIEAIRTGDARRPSRLRAAIPPELDAIVLRTLHRSPVERFPDMRALGAALVPFADGPTLGAWGRDFLGDETLPVRSSSKTRAASYTSEGMRAALTSTVGAEAAPSGAHPDAAARESARLPTAPRDGHLGPASEPSPARPPSNRPLGSPRATGLGALAPHESEVRPVEGLPCPPGTSGFNIKGLPYRGLLWAAEHMLPGGTASFLAALPDDLLRAFFSQHFLPSSRYDVLPMLPGCMAMARVLKRPLDLFVQDAAAAQARFDGRNVYRRLVESAKPRDLPPRVSRAGAQYYDFGTVEAELLGERRIVFRHGGVPTYVLPWFLPMHPSYYGEYLVMVGASRVERLDQRVISEGTSRGLPVARVETEMGWQ